MNVCAELESTRFGVKIDPLPDEPQSRHVLIEPTGVSSPEGSTIDEGRPKTSHVAEKPESVAEAFWALLERVGYIVW